MVWCLDSNLHFLGTLRPNRFKATQPWTVRNSQPRGTMNVFAQHRVADQSLTSFSFCFFCSHLTSFWFQLIFLFFAAAKLVSWKDHRVVNMLTTLPIFSKTVTKLVRKRHRPKRASPYEEITYNRPTVVEVYNHRMGGVDLTGFFSTYVKYPFRCHKWTVRVCSLLFFFCPIHFHD